MSRLNRSAFSLDHSGFALHRIRSSLASHEPGLDEDPAKRRAAVAVVLRDRAGAGEILFIERARNEADPWSGHMAFPGGRVDPGDASDREAAERETLEEVGVSLDTAEYLGRLDDLEGRHAGRPAGLVISAHVYLAADPEPLAPNHEVAEAFWFPVRDLADPARHVLYEHPRLPGVDYPGILVGDPDRHVVWGLTYRFLEIFLSIVGQPIPNRWGELAAR